MLLVLFLAGLVDHILNNAPKYAIEAEFIAVLASGYYYVTARRYKNGNKKYIGIFGIGGIILGIIALVTQFSWGFVGIWGLLTIIAGGLESQADEKVAQRFFKDIKMENEGVENDIYQLISICTETGFSLSIRKEALQILENNHTHLNNQRGQVTDELWRVVQLLEKDPEEERVIGAKILKIISQTFPTELEDKVNKIEPYSNDENQEVQKNIKIVMENVSEHEGKGTKSSSEDKRSTEENTNRCPNCSARMAEEDTFCRECGTNLEQNKCIECGEKIEKSNKYCTNCGAKVSA